MNGLACPLCESKADHRRFTVREMQFGTRETFEYAECANCGSLFLLNPPADMARYYPKDYYSFQQTARLHYPWWMRILKRARARYEMTGRGWLGKKVAQRQGTWPYYKWFREAGVGLNSSILDVGCGKGDYLLRFRSDGFTTLAGVDPFIEADIHHEGGITIYRREIWDMTGQYDCVLAMDSFEHMADPARSLRAMHALVKPGGAALIAIPVAESDAWKEYGPDWFQLDAPRHLTIPSAPAMKLLAEKSGFSLEKVLFDSKEDQFMFSDAYRRDIPLIKIFNGEADLGFTPAQRQAFQQRAAAANAAGTGDHACVILRRV